MQCPDSDPNPDPPDANPDPSDPHVSGPSGSGSGSTSQRYGSGYGSRSGSFYHQAKIVRKTLIPTVLWLLLDIFNNYVNVPSKSNKQKTFIKKKSFLLASWKSMAKIAGSGSASGSGSISQRHGSADPDPHQNVMDPEHCFNVWSGSGSALWQKAGSGSGSAFKPMQIHNTVSMVPFWASTAPEFWIWCGAGSSFSL